MFGTGFPWGTLVVNVLGSLILGVLVEVMALRWSVGLETRAFLITGVLGALTTFSTFSLDFAVLYERGDAVLARASDGREGVFDRVLCATGRRPNTAGLGLEAAGITPGRWGEVAVDEYGQSAVPPIHAVGDVTDRVNLTPVAIREGAAFVETVFRGNPTPIDHDLIPSAIFTQPEFGTVGLGEEAARDQEPVEVYCNSFKAMKTGFAGRGERSLVKLIVSRETRRVLGCHIVGEGAGEMIQLAAIAVKMGATKEDFDRTVAVHPTMAEEIVLMKTPVRVA